MKKRFFLTALLLISISFVSAQTQTFTVNGVSFKMVFVKGGTFTMGATPEQGNSAESREKPTHRVTLSDYYIGQTEVTQALWYAVMGSNPSHIKGENRPVDDVSWEDCQTFIRKLNATTGKNFRLPTEAEWEFAARGGNKSKHTKYAGSNYLGEVAWYGDNSRNAPHPVAQKSPNELGIYDMSGNVSEWCQDWYDGYYYRESPSANPCNNTNGGLGDRVLRGGDFLNHVQFCRVSYRDNEAPDHSLSWFGLRLALGIKVTKTAEGTPKLKVKKALGI